ncbi:MAG: hypothetical protein CME70_17315 [Halobacteriovorax sp.]|nr:hypothetical protein [Halobacteriovorax sp.]
MNLKKFKIVLLMFIYSFGLRASEELRFPNKFRLVKKTKLKHLGPENHITGIDSNRNFTDLDKDGVYDLVDSDIDGDGVTNYLDLHPLDKNKKGRDSDLDGIPDFVDFEVLGKLKEGMNKASANYQKELFVQKGIILFNGDFLFSNQEVKRISELYLKKELKGLMKLSNLKVLFKQPTHSMGYRAKFRHNHKAITLYENHDHKIKPFHQELTIAHESFHALSTENSEFYEEFLNLSGWSEHNDGISHEGRFFNPAIFQTSPELVIKTLQNPEFPNDYSKLGPEEMFAECATASLFNRKNESTLFKYPYLKRFKKTSLHNFFVSHFRTLLN